MYEAVHAYPDGESTVSRLAQTAVAYGFDGVVVRSQTESASLAETGTIVDQYDIDVIDGFEVTAETPQQASGAVGNVRTKHTLVAVAGGTDTINRFAVENDKVDVLARPMAGSGSINHVIAKAAIENGVRIEFDFGPVLRSSGGRRVRAIQNLTKLHDIVSYYDTPYVVSVNPRSHLELRAPRELCALGEQLGFDAEWIETGLAEWGVIASKNRHVQSESFIEPGVERGRYDPE